MTQVKIVYYASEMKYLRVPYDVLVSGAIECISRDWTFHCLHSIYQEKALDPAVQRTAACMVLDRPDIAKYGAFCTRAPLFFEHPVTRIDGYLAEECRVEVLDYPDDLDAVRAVIAHAVTSGQWRLFYKRSGEICRVSEYNVANFFSQ